MALTAYCKKCMREVQPGAVCPVCGGKLSAPHAFWRVSRRPLCSWISWNAPMRLILPCLGVLLAALAAAEVIQGGFGALSAFLSGPVPRVLCWLLAGIVLAVGLVLLLQGRHTCEISADKSGVTQRVLLADPGAIRLLAHFRSPRLLGVPALRMEYGLLLEERHLAWKDIRRVQLWPEQGLVLLYAPRWWMRMAVPCDGEGWQEITALIAEKLGRSKHTSLPGALRPAVKTAPARRSASSARTARGSGDPSLEEIRAMNAELERAESDQTR